MNYVLLGYGVVGTGIIELIEKAKQNISLYKEINLKGILVRDINKHCNKKYSSLVTEDINNIFSQDIDVVIEVMGGINPAYEYIKKALKRGIHVITANKDLIAEHGCELSKIAKENKVTIKLEAAVAGGIPIVKPLVELISFNEITSIKGILNGTTNFILTKMYYDGASYEEALKEAQRLGFAEANPESDVMGYDTARKLAILSSIAFNKKINWKDISIEGISNLDKEDLLYSKYLNCSIKLVGYSSNVNEKIYCTVRPVLVDSQLDLFNINNEVNYVILNGDAVGELSFKGNGAGMFPTASAICGDLRDILTKNFSHSINYLSDNYPVERYINNECEALLRITTEDISTTKELLNYYFKEIVYISSLKNNEVAVVVKVPFEKYLEDSIDKINNSVNISTVKKLLKFNSSLPKLSTF